MTPEHLEAQAMIRSASFHHTGVNSRKREREREREGERERERERQIERG